MKRFLLALALALCPKGFSAHVLHLKINGMIHSGTTQLVRSSLEQAQNQNAEALLITLDTPGGLLEATREIVKLMLSSSVPILVYVSPSGSRAGSAGTFITLAAHVAAMAPGTNMGAAHPVTATGEDPEKSAGKHMAQKIENDTLAWVENIATIRNRNVQWAKASVKSSASITADKALELKVIDAIAPNIRSLLFQMDGKKIQINNQLQMLNLKDASVKEVSFDLMTRFQNWLSDPTIMFGLVLIAGLGLYLEFTHPGLILPGACGLLAGGLVLFAQKLLPLSAFGIGLLGLALALFIAEIYITSFGLLTLGGVVSFIFGAYLLFDPQTHVQVPQSMIWGAAFGLTCLGLIIGYALNKVRTTKPMSGPEGMLGQIGEVVLAIHPKSSGKIFVAGEYWNAMSQDELHPKDKAQVMKVEGLNLVVKKVESIRE